MLVITGSDLLEIGIPKGKEIGLLLDKALDKVIHDPSSNKKDKLMSYCQSIYKNRGEE